MTRGSSEAAFISRMKTKDPRTYIALYDQYARALYSVILKLVENKNDAAMVLEQTFINVWKQIDNYDPAKQQLFTWMLILARKCAKEIVNSHGAKNLTSAPDD